MQPIYVSKILAVASSTAIGSISTAGGGTVTLSCALLDTARRITVTSASLSGPVYTVTGLNESLNLITEVITPSTTVGSAATTVQDFVKVTSVTLSCAITNSSGGLLIGTNTQGGTPWQVVDTTRNPINLGFNIQITSPATTVAVSFEYSMDYPAFNPVTRQWVGTPATVGPRPIISTLGSTVTSSATNGYITTPIQAWRITLTSTSSAAGSANASIIQSG
jgi:hypothetical protein